MHVLMPVLLGSLVIGAQIKGSIGDPVPSDVDFEERELSSGRKVRVTKVVMQALTRPTLVFEYASDIPLDNYESLQREVEEVWGDLQAVAEEKGVESVFILPETSDGTTVSFTLRRQSGEGWDRRSGFAYPPQEKLRL